MSGVVVFKGVVVGDGAGGQGLYKSRYWKKGGTSKAVLLSKFSQKLPRQRKSLTAQDDFTKIVDVVRRKLCFLNV